MMGIKLDPTDKQIAVEGQMQPVFRSRTGRLFVTVNEKDGNGYRQWNAKSMDLLKQRIERSESTRV